MSTHNFKNQERMAYENGIVKTDDATLTGLELENNKFIVCNKGTSMTLTIPAAIESFDGMARHIVNKGAGTATIAYTGASGAATRSLAQDATIRLDCDGSYWYAEPDLAGGIALASAKILVGSSGGAATARDLTGPWSISNTGVLSMDSATVAAAGTVQGDAGAIADGFTLVSAGDGTKGVVLPTAAAGGFAIVKNNANAILKLWPGSSDAIDALGADAAMSVAAYATVRLVAYDGTTWYSDFGAILLTGTAETDWNINTGGNQLILSSSGLGQDSTFTYPDVASDEIMTLTGTQTATNKTFTTPTIADLTNMTHAHTSDATGGAISAHAFGTITISGQTDVIADANGDTLTISSADSTIDFTSTPGTDTIDLSVIAISAGDVTEAAIANGDYIFFADGGASGTTAKEAVHDLATLFAGNGLAATSSVIAFDPNALTGEILADGDSIVFIDATDSNAPKKEALADLATLFAGTGLSASSSVMALDINGVGAAAVDVTADSIAIIDANASNATKKESIDDLVTALAGEGLKNATSLLALDLNELTDTAIADGDSFAFIDATDSSASKKETVADLATLFAGTGLSAASSVIAFAPTGLTEVAIANGDYVVFTDATDSHAPKKEALADLATLFAGTGLTATSSVIAVSLTDVTEVTVDVAADSLIITDSSDSNATKRDTIADVISGAAGNGLTASSGVLAVTAKTTWPMTLPGDMKLDADSQGGCLVGLVGSVDVAVTAEASTHNLAYNTDNDEFETVLASAAAWHAAGEYLPTADANDDACYIGSATKFMEFAIDVSGTVAAYSGDAGKYQYCKNALADGTGAAGSAYWGDLTIIQCTDDENATTGANAGKRPWSSDGVTTFVPPSDWVAATINSQEAYWIRWIVVDATKITTVGVATDEHDTIRANTLSLAQMPQAGAITGYRVTNMNATIHSGADVKVRLVNHTTYAMGDEKTWSQNRRSMYFATTSMTVSEGDMLGAVCTSEDSGNNDPLNVAFELDVTLA